MKRFLFECERESWRKNFFFLSPPFVSFFRLACSTLYKIDNSFPFFLPSRFSSCPCLDFSYSSLFLSFEGFVFCEKKKSFSLVSSERTRKLARKGIVKNNYIYLTQFVFIMIFKVSHFLISLSPNCPAPEFRTYVLLLRASWDWNHWVIQWNECGLFVWDLTSEDDDKNELQMRATRSCWHHEIMKLQLAVKWWHDKEEEQ